MAFHVDPGPIQPVSAVDRTCYLAARTRLRFGGSVFLRLVLFRQDHHSALLVLADVFLGWPAGHLPLLPLCANTPARKSCRRDSHIVSRSRCRRRSTLAWN